MPTTFKDSIRRGPDSWSCYGRLLHIIVNYCMHAMGGNFWDTPRMGVMAVMREVRVWLCNMGDGLPSGHGLARRHQVTSRGPCMAGLLGWIVSASSCDTRGARDPR